jgi:sugar/nucleoside kinase (ribokinase family)
MLGDVDALYVNFISGFEMCLGTAEALRRGFQGPIYADLHSLFLGMQGDGVRVLRPLPDAPSWFGCFDVIQLNEDEMNQLGPDPLTLAAAMLGAGVSTLVVTLGPRGAVYVTDGRADGTSVGRYVGSLQRNSSTDLPTYRPTVRTALIPAPAVDGFPDPTGCGDVFGAAVFSRLLVGEPIQEAVAAGNRAAARNVTFRGASGLASHLRGELVTP